LRIARLLALYAWFDRNAEVTGHVLRDAEHNATLREVSEMRFGAPLGVILASLSGGFTEAQRAALAVALSFYTWRTLVGRRACPAPRPLP
jgi:hypothetical protein